jgi:Fe-S-cluster-containing dehydrogenase component
MPRWGMVIDLDKCVGCQACTIACKEENNVPHGSPQDEKLRREAFWHKVIAASNGEYPSGRVEFIPMPCMHCDNPPCVTVCPAQATYRREDGIVMQNFRRCIGCKYCIAACPYGVRNFNYKESPEEEYYRPDLPPDRAERGPWPFPRRTHGVVEKCTFCFHRIDEAIREGKKVGGGLSQSPVPGLAGSEPVVPACVEACPTRARVFGDLDDPDSQVSQLLASRGGFRLREEMGTRPKVFYLHG